jgi:hypothetical protein
MVRFLGHWATVTVARVVSVVSWPVGSFASED